uniref:Uncharacterized protein n=1 Tax=Knipowitschia caucasica TaxID=637954 RepID=A0AAV2J0V2_KNICA
MQCSRMDFINGGDGGDDSRWLIPHNTHRPLNEIQNSVNGLSWKEWGGGGKIHGGGDCCSARSIGSPHVNAQRCRGAHAQLFSTTDSVSSGSIIRGAAEVEAGTADKMMWRRAALLPRNPPPLQHHPRS